MKNNLSLAFLFCAMCLIFNACEYAAPLADTEENTDRQTESWSLVKYTPSSFFPEQYESLEEGQIVWDFDMDAQSLDVSIQEVEKIDGLPYPGSYQFELTEHACNYGDNQFIAIEGRGYGVMITDYTDNDSLIISNVCVDGHQLLFVR